MALDGASRGAFLDVLRLCSRFLIVTMVVILLFIGAIRVFHIKFFHVSGESMSPTLHSGDSIAVKTIPDKVLVRGNLVFFVFPDLWVKNGVEAHPGGTLVKRVTGVPGDTVRVTSEGVWVNEKLFPHSEGYSCDARPKEFRIPAHGFLAFGDNPASSFDSRVLLCRGLVDASVVPMSDVAFTGKKAFRVFKKVL